VHFKDFISATKDILGLFIFIFIKNIVFIIFENTIDAKSRFLAEKANLVHGQREWIKGNQYFFSFVKVIQKKQNKFPEEKLKRIFLL